MKNSQFADVVDRLFSTAESEKQAHHLQNKYSPKPYAQRMRTLKTTVQAFSYTLNGLSSITAGVCIFFFVSAFTGAYFAIGCALLVCLFIEALKRQTLQPLFQRYNQYGNISAPLVVVVVVLSIVSALLSYDGAKQAISNYTPPPVLMNVDSLKAANQLQRATLQKRQDELKHTHTWRGKYTKAGTAAFQSIQNQIVALETRAANEAATATAHNEQVSSLEAAQTGNRANIFGYVSFCLDLLLILCIAFCEYYDYRSYVEVSNDDDPAPTTPPAAAAKEPQKVGATTPEASFDVYELAQKQAAANLKAYQNKIANGIGAEGTNKVGLKKWQAISQQIEAKRLRC